MNKILPGLILVISAVACIGSAAADTAVPVSPGGGTAITNQNCPTFSWSASEGAMAYRVEVYERISSDGLARDQMRVLSVPAVVKEIPAPALSWTPSSGECLFRGLQYVWYVQGVHSSGPGRWSDGSAFQVEAMALTVEQAEAVQAVVKGYLGVEGAPGSMQARTPSVSAASGTDAARKSASGITPMALPAVISAHGDTTNTFLGNNAGIATTSGVSNTFIGADAGPATAGGAYNTFIGNDAGKAVTSGSTNTLVGWSAGSAITTENNNTMVGNNAGARGSNNTMVGTNAGQMNQGNDNVFFGNGAGNSNSTGNSNTFVGSGAGYNNWGSLNVFIGNLAGYNDQGSSKLYISNSSTSTPLIYGEFSPTPLLRFNGNVGVGKTPSTALDVSGTVTATSFSGSGSGLTGVVTAELDPKVGTLTNGKWCTTDGLTVNCTSNAPVTAEVDPQVGALTAGKWCTSNGSTVSCTADQPVTSVSSNTYAGSQAGTNNTTGSENTFVGYQAGNANTTAGGNTFLGSYTGRFNTGGGNTFLGDGAGMNNTGGAYNVFAGLSSGMSNQTGQDNIFVGRRAGISNTGGNRNICIGNDACQGNIAGNDNTLLGHAAGLSVSGNGNVFIGKYAGRNADTSNRLYVDNCFADNHDTGGSCNQPFIYGEFDNRVLKIDGSLTMVTVATPSDIRYKKEIQPIESSLQKVLLLQGVTYEWDKERVNGAGYKSGKQIGLIAQEVEKVLPELVQTDEKGYKTLSYDKLAPVLIEAVKEQHALIVEQKYEIADLRDRLSKAVEMLERRLSALDSKSRVAGR